MLRKNHEPTIYELSQMSSDAYVEESGSNVPGWYTYAVAKPNSADYYGKCYVRDLHTPNAQVVFAHRGTVLKFSNLVGDLNIALERVPSQCDHAREFIMDCLKSIGMWDEKTKEYDKNIQVTYTGHSLGALIADTMFMFYRINGLEKWKTFENPGSKNISKKYWLPFCGNSEPYTDYLLTELYKVGEAYMGGVNIINSCNEQAVKVFRLNDLVYDYQAWDKGAYFPITSSYLTNIFYLVGNSKDQHGIDNIKKILSKSNASFTQITNPVGLNQGYVQYLDASNNKYWKDYFKYIWDNNPGYFRKEYNDDIDIYYQRCFEQLSRTQQQAKSSLLVTHLQSKNYNNGFVLFGENKKSNSTEEIINDFVLIENDIQEEQPSSCYTM